MRDHSIIYIISILLIVIVSCTKDTSITNERIQATSTEQILILGKQLQNPYSVSNMLKAYEALSPKTKANITEDSNDVVYATHLYVKFLPKTEDELSILKRDSTLVLYQYPLDYEIIQYGGYHDPSVPENQPTPLYASIPFNYNIHSDIEHEILEELFIPDGEECIVTKGGMQLTNDFVDELVEKSLEMTGNLDTYSGTTKGCSKWHPQGIVKYYDSELNKTLGIEGLQIRCQRWFTTHKMYTKSDGSFYCDKTFKHPANYSIVFERYDFEIRDAWLSTAKYDGPKKSGYWSVDFSGDKTYTYYSTIFRAAYKYYYQDIHNLSRPPLNGIWKTQLKIKASKKSKDYLGYHSPILRFLGLGSAIHIYTFNKDIVSTYATTIHELAHATHWGLYKSDYNKADIFILESWTRGVQWFLTKDIYPGYSVNYSTVAYTGLIHDLLDGDGLWKTAYSYYDINSESISLYSYPKSYMDNVGGYTMPEIENSLNGARTIEQWKNNLKESYKNESEKYLDSAFNFWANK